MKRVFLVLFTVLLSSVLTSPVFARNVSYVGGWTLTGAFDADAVSTTIHYTLDRKYSIGYRYKYFRDKEWSFNGLQFNYLVHRWNKPASQANFYWLSNIGHAYSDFEEMDHKQQLAGSTGIALDWEDRRYFISYSNHVMNAGDIDHFFIQKARIGIAPYIAEYGDLHTWLMLELKHDDYAEENLTATPLVRFFKGATMFELGWNIEREEVLINIRQLF